MPAASQGITTSGDPDGEILRLERRIAQLEAVRADLEQFASVLCHDLQAPITVQQLKAAVIRRQVEKGNWGAVAEATRDLDQVNQRMSAMIQAVLGFSRAGNAALEREVCDLTAITRNALAMHELDVRATGAVVDINDLPHVAGDEAMLTLLMQNLIGNAIKYHRDGAVPRIRIDEDHDAPAGFVAIEVHDNGRGFSPEQATQIMQPFERLATDVSGHGIGLATCRRIVERHGGRLDAIGRPDGGATFRVELPADR